MYAETTLTHRSSWPTVALRWMPTFLGFPLGGLATKLVVGPIDAPAPAIVGGAITGIALGLAQWLGMRQTEPAPIRWIVATAASSGRGQPCWLAHGRSAGQSPPPPGSTSRPTTASSVQAARSWSPLPQPSWRSCWPTGGNVFCNEQRSRRLRPRPRPRAACRARSTAASRLQPTPLATPGGWSVPRWIRRRGGSPAPV